MSDRTTRILFISFVQPIPADNGKKVVPSYLLTPVAVDKTNYEKIIVEGGYYKADQLK